MLSVLKSLALLAASTRAWPIFSNDIDTTYNKIFNHNVTFEDYGYIMTKVPNLVAKTGITATSTVTSTQMQYGVCCILGCLNYSQIYAGGSYTDSNGKTILSKEVAVFDPKEITWSIKEMLSIGRMQMTAGFISNDNEVILAGGLEMQNNVLVPSALIEKYSFPLNSVSVLPCVLSPARYGIGAITKRNSNYKSIFFAGGFTSATSATDVVEVYSSSVITKFEYKLSKARGNIATARVFNTYNQIDLFVGGSENADGTKPSNAVDIFFEWVESYLYGPVDFQRWYSTTISVARSLIGTTSDLNPLLKSTTIFAGGFTGTETVDTVDIYRVNNNYGVWTTTKLPVPMCGLTGIPWSTGVIFAGGHTRTATTMTPSDLVFVYINSEFQVIKLNAALNNAAITIANFKATGASKSYLFLLGRNNNGELVFDYLAKGEAIKCRAGEYRVKNECTRCPNGYYGDSNAALSTNPMCSGMCAAGRYGDSTGEFDQLVTYKPSGFLTSSECTGICLPGYFCPPGSVSSTQSLCSSNSFSDYGASSCTTCSTGQSIGSVNQARKIKLVYVPDINPLEVSLKFTDSTGNVLFSLNPDKSDMRGGIYEFDYNGAPKSKLTFNIADKGGDGICCEYGGGSYYAIYVDGVLIRRGGNFKSVDTYTFEAGQKQICVTSNTPQLATNTSKPTTTTSSPTIIRDLISTTTTEKSTTTTKSSTTTSKVSTTTAKVTTTTKIITTSTKSPVDPCSAKCNGLDVGFPMRSRSNNKVCLRFFEDSDCARFPDFKFGGGNSTSRECLSKKTEKKSGGSISLTCQYPLTCCTRSAVNTFSGVLQYSPESEDDSSSASSLSLLSLCSIAVGYFSYLLLSI